MTSSGDPSLRGSEDETLILVCGEALFDLVLDDGDELRAHPGGGPFNTARTVARLGPPVAFLGRLSTDRLGARLERLLAADGVRLDAVVHTDEPTTLALAEVGAGGSARYRFYERATAAPGLTPQDALAAVPDGVSVLHVGTLGLALEPVASALEAVVEQLAPRALVAVDPNCRPGVVADEDAYRARLERVIRRSHLVKVSEDDLAWLCPGRPSLDAARALLDRGPAVVLLTMGGEGAVAVTASGDARVRAPATRVVDTIGAGDAFGGGFLAWWHERGLGPQALRDPALVREATKFAVRVAARTCERAGAEPPRAAEMLPG